ncbi:hypothetical protein [Phocaeicola sp.]
MENKVLIKGQEIDLTDRKVQCEVFGKQFKVNASAEEVIKMCDERIKSYGMYISNLRELKQAKLAERANGHKEELKAMLAAMSEEERTNFINGLN